METILDNQSINEPNKNELKKTEYAKHQDPRSVQDKNEPYKNGTNTTEKDKTEYDKTDPNKISKNKNEPYKKDLNEHGPDENDPAYLTSNLPCLVFSTPGVAKLSEAAIAEHAREIAFLDDMLALCRELHYTIGTLEIEGQEVLYRVQYWGNRMNVVATNPLDKRVYSRAIMLKLKEEDFTIPTFPV